jgi:hypothetical protein
MGPMPGQHIQVDLKFLKFNRPDGKKVKRFQYTVVDDATRIRALKIYTRHTQKNDIDFINYVIDKFPFRIHTVEQTMDMNSRPNFIGMWRIKESAISTLNLEAQISIAR